MLCTLIADTVSGRCRNNFLFRLDATRLSLHHLFSYIQDMVLVHFHINDNQIKTCRKQQNKIKQNVGKFELLKKHFEIFLKILHIGKRCIFETLIVSYLYL